MTKTVLITGTSSGIGKACLLYTSDAADERSSVDLGGRRIIKKKKRETIYAGCTQHTHTIYYTNEIIRRYQTTQHTYA